MAFTYRIASSTSIPWAGMVDTALLSDGTTGDTGTGEAVTSGASGTSAPYCSAVSCEALIVAQVYLATSHALTGFSFKGSMTAGETVGANCIQSIEPIPLPTPGTGYATLQTSPDGDTWTDRATLTLDAPDLTGSPPYSSTFNESGVLSVSACWVRLLVGNSQNTVAADGGVSATVTLTDFRLTGTDTGTSCMTSGGGGGGETGDGDGTIDGWTPGESDCSSSWTPTASGCSTVWTKGADC